MDIPGIDRLYVLAHPAYFRQVLADEVDAFGKTEDFRRAFGNGLLSTEGEKWREQRERLQPLFYRNHVERYAGRMVECTDRRLATWTPGETRDVEAEMRDLTLEILFSTLLGRELRPNEEAGLRAAADGLNEWFTPTSWMLPRWLPTPARRRFARADERLREEVRTLLAAATADDRGTATGGSRNDEPTLLSRLGGTRRADAGSDPDLDAREIEDQLVTMIFAGYETTATTLAFSWHLLGTHPAVRRAFHEELDAVLGDHAPSRSDLPDLEVTGRIVTEALRLYPPAHTIPRQTKRDVSVGGYRIPEGSHVHLSVISVHRDERFYERPLAFEPDRWDDGLERRPNDFAYVPFGAGRRTCIGRAFALLEATLVLATIGHRFRLEPDHDGDTNADTGLAIEPRITTRSRNGIPMRIHRR